MRQMSVTDKYIFISYILADFVKMLDGILNCRIRHKHQKFFSTISASYIHALKLPPQQRPDICQYFIARFMTIQVIKLFEIINIDHADTKCSLFLNDTIKDGLHDFIQIAAII